MLEIAGIGSRVVTEYRPSTETGPSSVSLRYQTGTKLPDPLLVGVCSKSPDFTVSVVTSSGGDWLSAPAAGVSHCMADFPIMVDPSSLAPGVYSGSVAFSFAGHQTASFIAVSLVVSADPFIAIGQRNSLSFTAPMDGTLPASQTVTVSSSGTAARFTATPSFTSGANWFSVTPSTGITPQTLTITTNPSGLLAGYYSGNLQISGPANNINLAVELKVEAPGADVLPTLQWSVQTGTLGAIKRSNVVPYLVSDSVATDSGGSWLKIVSRDGFGAPFQYLQWINVSVDATGLAAGEYDGRITLINRDGKAELLPVRLIVWSSPPRLAVTPSSLTFTTDNTGNLPEQTLHVSSGGIPVEVTVSVQGQAPWIYLPMTTQFTPADFRIASLVYELGTTVAGTVTIAGAGQTVVVPVTAKVTTTFTLASTAPLLAAVTNAATQLQGGVAPGEIITIFGFPLGPGDPQVLFDGRLAQVLYSSLTQVNAIVPDSVAGQPFTMLEVDRNGLRSDVWGVPVVRAAPGIFTADSSGQGQAVALNEDNSLNSPANPARRVIRIFTTGVTDQVSAIIAGVSAEVQSYSGNQVNVVVPPTVVLGIGAAYALPVVIMAGGARSQDGVTIAVTL